MRLSIALARVALKILILLIGLVAGQMILLGQIDWEFTRSLTVAVGAVIALEILHSAIKWAALILAFIALGASSYVAMNAGQLTGNVVMKALVHFGVVDENPVSHAIIVGGVAALVVFVSLTIRGGKGVLEGTNAPVFYGCDQCRHCRHIRASGQLQAGTLFAYAPCNECAHCHGQFVDAHEEQIDRAGGLYRPL